MEPEGHKVISMLDLRFSLLAAILSWIRDWLTIEPWRWRQCFMSQMTILFEVNPVHTTPIQRCVLILLVKCALKILQEKIDTSKLGTISTDRPSVDAVLGLYIIAIERHFEISSSLNMHAVWHKISLLTVAQLPITASCSYHLLFLPLTASSEPYSCITHTQSIINHIPLSKYICILKSTQRFPGSCLSLVFLSIYPVYLSIYLPTYLPTYLIHLPTYFIHLRAYPPTYLFNYLSYPPTSLSVCLSIYLSVALQPFVRHWPHLSLLTLYTQ
jgi:hypothetical protein